VSESGIAEASGASNASILAATKSNVNYVSGAITHLSPFEYHFLEDERTSRQNLSDAVYMRATEYIYVIKIQERCGDVSQWWMR
jgi:hypothetical protein